MLIGLQIVAARCVMRAMSHHVGFGSDGSAGLTNGFGLATVMLALRGRFGDDEAADGDRE